MTHSSPENASREAILEKAIRAVIDASGAYLPPDGISKDEFINRVLGATDNTEVFHALNIRAQPAASPENASSDLIEECLAIVDKHLNGHAGLQYRAACENIGREISALRISAQCAPWQPIETAPKDGTWILVFEPGGYASTIQIVRWAEPPCPGVWDKTWITLSLGPDNDVYEAKDATHWIPLPAAPAALTSPGCRAGNLFPDIGSQEPDVIRDADDIQPQQMPTREEMAGIVYEGAHKGLKNCWKWTDDGLDAEHPGRRGYYYKIADAVLAALSHTRPECSPTENKGE